MRATRVAVVVASFVVPFIPALYLGLWILLPRSPAAPTSFEAIARGRRMPLVIALGIVLVALGFGSIGQWFRFGAWPLGTALIGIGVLLWISPDLFGSRQDRPPVAVAFTDAPVAVQTVVRRRRAPIGLAAVGVALLFAGVVALLDVVGAWHPATLVVAMTALGLAVAGLVVSTLVNRSLIGLPVILVLAAVLSFLAIARPRLEGGIGERTVVVTSAAESGRTERLGIGRLTVDLRSEQAATYALDATVGVGRLEVLVPAGATLHLHSHVGAGAVRMDDRTLIDGVRVVDQRDVPATAVATAGAGAGAPRTIDLSLAVGAGAVLITHGP